MGSFNLHLEGLFKIAAKGHRANQAKGERMGVNGRSPPGRGNACIIKIISWVSNTAKNKVCLAVFGVCVASDIPKSKPFGKTAK